MLFLLSQYASPVTPHGSLPLRLQIFTHMLLSSHTEDGHPFPVCSQQNPGSAFPNLSGVLLSALWRGLERSKGKERREERSRSVNMSPDPLSHPTLPHPQSPVQCHPYRCPAWGGPRILVSGWPPPSPLWVHLSSPWWAPSAGSSTQAAGCPHPRWPASHGSACRPPHRCSPSHALVPLPT